MPPHASLHAPVRLSIGDAVDKRQLSKAKVGASRRLIERSLPVGFRLNYVENRTPSGGDAVIQLSLLQSEL